MNKRLLVIVFVILFALITVLILFSSVTPSSNEIITVNEFFQYIINKNIQIIEVFKEANMDSVKCTLNNGKVVTTHIPSIQDFLSAILSNNISLKMNSGSLLLSQIIQKFVFMIFTAFELFMIVLFFQNFSGSSRSFNKNLTSVKSNTKFRDIIGMKQEKREMIEVLELFTNIEKFMRANCKPLHGVVLFGPPGNGKTYLAKAIAGEISANFYAVSGSEFVEMFVGVGASRVRNLFAQARKSESKSIIFIDEVDALGKRGGEQFRNSERESTINEMLVAMDGIIDNSNILVIFATNKLNDVDSALLRPGRIDKQIYVGHPFYTDRQELINLLIRRSPIPCYADSHLIARITGGFSRADIANLVNEAKILSIRDNSEIILTEHFLRALDRIRLGSPQPKSIMSAEETERTALHECGHALMIIIYKKYVEPLYKITILPHGKALGVAMTESLDKVSVTKEYLEAKICICLGGRIAEEIFYSADGVTSGCSSDLTQARSIIENYIINGMDDIYGLKYISSSYHLMSEYEKAELAKRINDIMKEMAIKTKSIMQEYKVALRRAADMLLIKDTLYGPEFENIINGKSFLPIKINYIKNI